MSKFKNIWEKYKKIEIIGSSASGNVYRAKYNNEHYAIKEIKKIKPEGIKNLREIEVMKKMECDNSIKLIENFETKRSFYIISELCFSNLAEYLNTRKQGLLIEEIK